MNHSYAGLCMLLCLVVLSGCQTVEKATENATPAAASMSLVEQDRLVREAVSLHDKGKYGEAVELYRKVLSANPQNEGACYELSFTLYTMKDFAQCIAQADKGIALDGSLRPQFYMVKGSALDDSNNPLKAIETFRQGLQRDPNFFHLHFNLGLTLLKTGEIDNAVKEFETSASLNSQHTSSFYTLGFTYEKKSFRTPTLYAYIRFLILEPVSTRSVTALARVREYLIPPARGESATIIMNPDLPKDLGPLDLMLGFLAVQEKTRDGRSMKDLSPIEAQVEKLDTLITIMDELQTSNRNTGFLWEKQLPYFLSLRNEGHLQTAVYLINAGSRDAKVVEWLNANKSSVEKLLSWNKTYNQARNN
ncbi:MAG: tetratricopeptide repeat protein [Spirochaetaceae bacterium]|nr:MAG: tetratricopeptide repeat protein [Spirochaetaceae bacterium]